MILKSYKELSRIDSFEDRYAYLRIGGSVGSVTFGADRYLNQVLYHSYRWKKVRDHVIFRDNACDLGVEGYEIFDKIIIHHMNPLTIEDIEEMKDCIFDPEFLICVSNNTHNAIHYGDANLLRTLPKDRFRNDTCPWKL